MGCELLWIHINLNQQRLGGRELLKLIETQQNLFFGFTCAASPVKFDEYLFDVQILNARNHRKLRSQDVFSEGGAKNLGQLGRSQVKVVLITVFQPDENQSIKGWVVVLLPDRHLFFKQLLVPIVQHIL